MCWLLQCSHSLCGRPFVLESVERRSRLSSWPTIATVETARGSGPFAQNTSLINAVLLDVFFAVLSMSSMTLAAVIAEREQLLRQQATMETQLRAKEAVRESEDKLRPDSRLDRRSYLWN